ncbi:hypothetical protein ACQY0O_007287 [Thecaphora frezii]
MERIGRDGAPYESDSSASGAHSPRADERRQFVGTPGIAAGPSRLQEASRGPQYLPQEPYRYFEEQGSYDFLAPRARAGPRDEAARSWTGEDYADDSIRRGTAERRRWDDRDAAGYPEAESGYASAYPDRRARYDAYADNLRRERQEQDRWDAGHRRYAPAFQQQPQAVGLSAGPRRDDYAPAYRYGTESDVKRPDDWSRPSGAAQLDFAGPSTVATQTASSERYLQPEKSERPDATRGSGAGASPEGFSKVSDGLRYRLEVVQHPNRARMCGFGDKDRRPLSPTLIVKLVITDEATGKEISPLDVNTSLFLLATDLCHPDDLMLAPRNILVHHNAPAVPFSGIGYSSNAASHGVHSTQSLHSHADFASKPEPEASQPPGRRNGVSEAGDSAGGGHLPPIAALDLPGRSRSTSSTARDSPPGPPRSYGELAHGAQQFSSGFAHAPAESYTRNLVGAAVASASVLKDESEKWCTFFVFQDISVRTEGVYRIKLMFVNLEVNGRVGTGVSEALAETYTEPFTVYSPRKFPGMLDPTPLSRKLASQGIKIPVRNDKKKQRRRAEDGDPNANEGGLGPGGYEDDGIDDDNEED